MKRNNVVMCAVVLDLIGVVVVLMNHICKSWVALSEGEG